MLSDTSAETVRATLPIVSGAIDKISACFYDRLFAAHPELLRDLFNRGNQANGAQQQALAGAIAGFASALVAPSQARPAAMLDRIAHKHASLGIAPDQYRIVHTHLFAAIAEVLGDAVTDEVAAAWDEVYWLLANTLISMERRLYAEADAPAGDVWRDYRVVGRTQEADDVVSFLVRPLDGTPPPLFRPGQYVSVQVELPDGARQIRQYSLSSARSEALHFTVKAIVDPTGATPNGEVSTHLHTHLHAGHVLRISVPFGDVTLDEGDDRPVLLISAGIGCTPMIAMLDQLVATGSPRRVVALHGDRTQRTHALSTELGELVRKLPDATAHVWYEQPAPPWPAHRTGRVELSAVPLPDPRHSVAYLCGPLPFLCTTHNQLRALGMPTDDIHYEVFGPDLWRGEG
ncbi:globin domain-containing protein [Streptomyces zagrosensis]|uniref:nitric oxide dioxygenase n=1 Tax=Streptomyces zagrosensis TaxID=1042984 RepID=A0A7W9Q6X8_9ACTN|nr:globin domain-containing protein [Streptomyces zagrosensis]MBB5934748.1 nitric oxide dioxygenase [Streptomyces zagrosensis]